MKLYSRILFPLKIPFPRYIFKAGLEEGFFIRNSTGGGKSE
jgi:hypothetical protein